MIISEKARKEVEVLAKEAITKTVTPEVVVSAATDPDSALHEYFPWDDAVAAHAHRIEIARLLIRSVVIVERRGSVRIEVPVYLRDPLAEPRQAGYRTIVSLRSDRELALKAFENELSRVCSMVERMSRVASALGFEIEIRRVVDQLDRLYTAAQATM